MEMSTEKTLVVNAMCNTHKFLSLGNNTHSCISHTIHKYNNYVITLVCVAARVTPALVDDHCYTFSASCNSNCRLRHVSSDNRYGVWFSISQTPDKSLLLSVMYLSLAHLQ